jgi:hypothetical protein
VPLTNLELPALGTVQKSQEKIREEVIYPDIELPIDD